MNREQALEAELDASTRDRRNLQRQLEESHKLELMNAAALDAVNERNTELEREIEDLKTQLTNEQAECHRLRSERAYKAGQVEGLTESGEMLKGAIATREAELGQAHARIEELDKARLQGIKMLGERDARIKELEETIAHQLKNLKLEQGETARWLDVAIRRKKVLQEALFRWKQLRTDNGMETDSHIEKLRQEGEGHQAGELARWLVTSVLQPPMACYTCEQHNDNLCDLVRIMNAVCRVVDDEYGDALAGRAWSAARIFEEARMLRVRMARLPDPLGKLFQVVTQYGPFDPVSEEDYEKLLEALKNNPPASPLDTPAVEVALSERDKIERDMTLFGTGFGRIRGYGRIEHIPAEEVLVQHAPNASELGSDWGKNVIEALKRFQIIGVDPGSPEGDRTVVQTLQIETISTPAIRGVDFDCEECGARDGSTLNDGWYRCNNCGYPSK